MTELVRVPIIDRQRALAEAGQIRCGDEKEPKKPGRKLETFRITSQHRDLVDAAADKYGGEVKPWESPTGPAWQVVTTKSAVPCLIVVDYSLTLMYELWDGATKATRRCDGVTDSLSGEPCLCNASGVAECDTITRLMVVLPELGTMLGWKLRSTGESAARELSGSMEIASAIAGGKPFVPAVLRLTQRRSNNDGQTVRFVVPVLDLDLQTRALLEAAPPSRQLEAGVADGRTSVASALTEVDRRRDAPRRQTARSQAPIGAAAPPPPTGGAPAKQEVGEPAPPTPKAEVIAETEDVVLELVPEEVVEEIDTSEREAKLLELAGQLGIGDAVVEYVATNKERNKEAPERHAAWIEEQIVLAEKKLVAETEAAAT